MTILSAILMLLVIMDPVGNVANFIAGLQPVAPAQRLRVIARELVFAPQATNRPQHGSGLAAARHEEPSVAAVALSGGRAGSHGRISERNS